MTFNIGRQQPVSLHGDCRSNIGRLDHRKPLSALGFLRFSQWRNSYNNSRNPATAYNQRLCTTPFSPSAMPIYAYRCTSCGHTKDILQKMSDPVLTDCPACGAGTFTKQVTAAGFQLKGSGWYATDFRNGSASGEKPAATSETPSADASKPAESTASKVDATPASASTSTPAASSTTSSNTAT